MDVSTQLFLHLTSYSYVRYFQIAYNKCPRTFCHYMDRALLLSHCVYQENGGSAVKLRSPALNSRSSSLTISLT
ncbi:unnamed protein product [Callosobruchus maculatus]|uniref:Uncharacterized protein n=1 Tax=Callosobruchus maculatus TaxID=64391 RepID=A0A653D020_CALMS|nr:unnamed protein product [Callosobruchus maculatus]